MSWHIQVRIDEFGNSKDDCFVAVNPFEKAVMVSKSNPSKDVWVVGFARLRRVYRDGVVVRDNPNLSKFYRDVSKNDARCWEKGLEINS